MILYEHYQLLKIFPQPTKPQMGFIKWDFWALEEIGLLGSILGYIT